jgi:hypothetical protein
MNKYIKDGKVAVLYSPGFGAGWYSLNSNHYGKELLFDKELVKAVLSKDKNNIMQVAQSKFPNAYLGGLLDNAQVKWIPIHSQFHINEVDGDEKVILQ